MVKNTQKKLSEALVYDSQAGFSFRSRGELLGDDYHLI